MPPRTAPETDKSLRVVVSVLLLTGITFLVLVLGAGEGGSEEWDEPVVTAPRVQERGDPPPVARQDTDPLDVEVLLEPRAALVVPGARRGSERLVVESFSGEVAVEARLRFVMGPAAGDEVACEGRTVIDGLSRGAHFVAVERAGYLAGGTQDRSAWRIVRLPRRAPLAVDWSLRGNVRGAVFGPRGEPVAGASVQVGGAGVDTGADGGFWTPSLVAGDGVPVVVVAEGLASYFELVRVGAGETSLRFVLSESWRLRGTVHIPAGERDGARVALLPRSDRPAGTHAFPFFLSGRYSDVPVDASGRFMVAGLPAGLPVAVALVHPTWSLRETVDVAPPRSRRRPVADVHLAPVRQTVLRGSVAGPDGAPLQGAVITGSRVRRLGRSATGRSPVPLPRWLAYVGGTYAVSDAGGGFRVGLPWPRTRIRVSARGHVGEERVVPRARRQIARFALARADGPAADSGDHVLVLRLRGSERSVLRVQLRWGGRREEAPFLHDPAEPLVLTPLERPALVGVGIRVPGQAGEPVLREVTVRGRTEVVLDVPRP